MTNDFNGLLLVALLLVATLPGAVRLFAHSINRQAFFTALVRLAQHAPDKFPKLLRLDMRSPLVALCREAYELRHLPSDALPPGGYRAGAEGRPYRERLAEAIAPALDRQRGRILRTAPLLLPGLTAPVVLLVVADHHGPSFIGAVVLALLSAYWLLKVHARLKDLDRAAAQLPEVLELLDETERKLAAKT